MENKKQKHLVVALPTGVAHYNTTNMASEVGST